MPVETPGSSRRVEARAEKRFFISMLVKDIELIPAIVDLVDNSVDGARNIRQDGDFSGLWIDIEANPERFSIRDKCGGISTDLARRYAFRFGRPESFTGIEGSVGQFGVGMKRALFKLGKAFEIESKTEATRFLLRVNVEEWAADASPDWTFAFDEVDDDYVLGDGEEPGTSIVVDALHDSVSADFSRSNTIAALRADLRLRHQDALQAGMRISVNGDVLTGRRPALVASSSITPIRKRFAIDADGDQVDVELFAGVVHGHDDGRDEGEAEDFARESEAGWYLFCNRRLLFAAERSRLTGWGEDAAAYHPQYRNFRGYVYLSARDSSLLPWNTTKTGVDQDSPIFRSVQSEMAVALKRVQTVINRLKKERQERPDDDRPLARALEEAEEVPLGEVPESETMRAPPAPTTPRPDVQRIQYSVERERFERVREELGASQPGEVGRSTFEYFYEEQVL